MDKLQENALGRLLYLSAMSFRNYLENHLKPYDLTAEQFHVMKCLIEEDGVTQSRLCTSTYKSPANVTRILDRLEKKRCLERRNNPGDRRSSLVHLTGQGELLMAKIKEELADCEAKVTTGLSPQEVQVIKDGLKIIRYNMEQSMGEQAK
ncbi:MarR family winged helix-turn-helix transcriptional regulator [Desulfosediminicola sp.]|uniref:MarR family winged helix-turn-helix transcriptional regulator n=1 Tax=Desulfosediminicola sp. TaxID=2886825 RepID=UPI003AF30445